MRGNTNTYINIYLYCLILHHINSCVYNIHCVAHKAYDANPRILDCMRIYKSLIPPPDEYSRLNALLWYTTSLAYDIDKHYTESVSSCMRAEKFVEIESCRYLSFKQNITNLEKLVCCVGCFTKNYNNYYKQITGKHLYDE